jgi:hypothetical protein
MRTGCGQLAAYPNRECGGWLGSSVQRGSHLDVLLHGDAAVTKQISAGAHEAGDGGLQLNGLRQQVAARLEAKPLPRGAPRPFYPGASSLLRHSPASETARWSCAALWHPGWAACRKCVTAARHLDRSLLRVVHCCDFHLHWIRGRRVGFDTHCFRMCGAGSSREGCFHAHTKIQPYILSPCNHPPPKHHLNISAPSQTQHVRCPSHDIQQLAHTFTVSHRIHPHPHPTPDLPGTMAVRVVHATTEDAAPQPLFVHNPSIPTPPHACPLVCTSDAHPRPVTSDAIPRRVWEGEGVLMIGHPCMEREHRTSTGLSLPP